MVLRAEREARSLGLVAAASGGTVVLLKGGVPAVMSATPPYHLLDVDILVRNEIIPAVDRALASSGFKRAENNELHHTHWVAPPGRLPVEVHSTINAAGKPVSAAVWSRVQPLTGIRGLSRLGWPDQIVHLLQHSLEQHNDRHVRIRDILMIGWFDTQADAQERALVERQLAELPDAKPYLMLLDFARRVRDGDANDDPFEDHAILHFAAGVLAERRSRNNSPDLTWTRAATVAAGSTSFFGMVGFAAKNPVTGKTPFSTMQRKVPILGRAVTRLSRSGYYFLSVALGAPILLGIRRAVRRDMLRDSAKPLPPT
jgi:hypothetical protein